MTGSCAACGGQLDPRAHGTCAVCEVPYCLACARAHYCMADCGAKGCKPGGCVKLVRDGVIASRYGVTDPDIRSAGHPH